MSVEPGIVIPLIVIPVAIIVAVVWYRRSMANLKPDAARPVSGVRLTAEALHRLDSPPWRVVYEIGGSLGGVDHVVIGPPGIIAISTVVADRPRPIDLIEVSGEARLMSDAAVTRGPVDELARAAALECKLSARVFWGSPDPSRPDHDELVRGSLLVEGQRLELWLATLAEGATLEQSQIDVAWQAIVMGIGRPNPLP